MSGSAAKYIKAMTESWVLTPNGLKELSEIKVGDIVIGSDEGKQIHQRVASIRYFPRGVHNSIVINDEHAFSPDQSIFIYREGKKVVYHASLIREGDLLYRDDGTVEIVQVIENITHSLKKKRPSLHLEEINPIKRIAQKLYNWWTNKPAFNRSYYINHILVHNATRFWVGGSGNWDAADTTHWAATSGGASGASVPTSSDTVTADSNSGAAATATITGTTALASSITINKSDFILLHGAAGSTTAGTVTLTTGKIDTNSQTCSWGIFSSNNANTRNITMATTSLTLTTASQTVWATNNATNFTFSCASATITCNASTQSIAMVSSQTIGTLIMSGAAATFSTSGTVTTMRFTGSGTATISSALTTVNFERTGTASTGDSLSIVGSLSTTGTFTLAGQSTTNRLLVQSSVFATRRTITNTGATEVWSYVDIQDIGLTTPYDASASTGGVGDAGNNLNITFTTSTTQNLTMSTAKNWNDVTIWTSRIPLPQDDITSTAWTGGTLSVNMPRLARNMDFTGATGSCTLSVGGAYAGYGSFQVSSAVTISGAGNGSFRGTGTHTLTMSGKSFGGQVTIQARSGGSYALNDAFSGGSNVTLAGVFNSNNFNITGSIVSISGITSGDLGTSTITCTTTTNTTFFTGGGSAVTSGVTIILSAGAGVDRTFAGGSRSYAQLQYIVSFSNGALVISGSNTISTLRVESEASAGKTVRFTNGTTQTISNWLVNGVSALRRVSLVSTTPGSSYNINLPTQQSSDWNNVTDMQVIGGPLYVGLNSVNGGNNNALVIFGVAFTPQVIMY